jgi:serine/threonine-protein kinase
MPRGSEPAPARRAPRRPGLLFQIGLALALVGVVPLALAAWSLVGVNREALVDQLLRTHTVSARTAADAIDAFLATRRALAGALAEAPEIAADPTSVAAQARLRDSLAGWSEAGVVAAAVYGADGERLVQAQQKGMGALAEKLLGGRPGAPARLHDIELHPWLRIEIPVAGAADGVALRLAVDAQPLLQSLAPDELGEQAKLLLADRGGAPLLGRAEDLAALPAPMKEAAFLARLSGSGRYRDASGRIVVGAWSAADEGRWVVISTQPAAVAESAARRMARRSALAVAAALAIVGALSFVAWRSLVQPLRALLAAQRQVAGLSSAPSRGSETAELRSAMAALERNARDRAALDQVFLGRFQVIEILGSGGMGTVFRGWDPHLQRPVALKTIRLEGKLAKAEGEAPVGRLLAEAVAAAQIAHPNVVAIFDAEESGGIGYVAMEYVHGSGLDRYLESRGRLAWREVVPLGREIAQGLSAAHQRGLVHRDIKPGNVLLGHDGSVKIADFGLAQFVSMQKERSGTVVGTPGFIPPEALTGEPYDGKGDLFAFGVVLHRALLGRYPFQGRTLREVIQATLSGPTIAADEFGAEVPRELAELVAGLLEREPERRSGPAAVVAAKLGEIARVHHLTWHLDFARVERAIDSDEVFASLALPVTAAPSGPGD